MDLLDVYITKIHSEEELKRTVRVTIDTDSYGGKKTITVGFLKHEWPTIKHRMRYPESRPMDEATIQEFEHMSEKEWIRYHYSCDIRSFSDEEIVNEFNYRLNDTLFHKIAIKSEAIIFSKR